MKKNNFILNNLSDSIKKQVKHSLILFALLCSGISYGQHTDAGRVLSVLQYGTEDIAIIYNLDDETHYKSTVYANGELAVEQTVELNFPSDPEQLPQVVASTLTSTVHASLMTVPSGDGSPSANLIYALPDEENDILFFNSQQHLFDVYAMMDDYLEETSTADLSEDEKLDIIQDQYPGFTSYRNKYFDTYLPSGGLFAYDDIVNAYDREFVNYNVLQTFLNEDRMIGIDNKIYYYHGEDFIVEFDKTDSESRTYLEGVSRKFFLSQDIDLTDDPGFIELTVRGLTIVISNIVSLDAKGFIGDPNTGWAYQTVFDLDQNSSSLCNSMTKSMIITLEEVQNYNGIQGPNPTEYNIHPWGIANATLEIDWADGSPVQVISNYDGSEIEHTYSTEGVFDVHTTLTFIDRFGDTQVIEDGSNASTFLSTPIIFNTAPECTEAEAHESYATNLNEWMLVGKVWVQDNLITKQVGSSSHAYKLVNGSYQQKNARIHTKVNGTFRNNDCNVVETKSGDKTRNNRKNISKTKSKLFKKFRRFGTLDVNSYHFLDEGGTFISFNIFIDC